MNVEERHKEQVLKRAKAAEFEMHISRRSDGANCNFQQLEPDGINAIFSHVLRQNEPPKPVEKIVSQRMNLNTVGVDDLGRTADIAHVKTAFAFFDEILHVSTLAIEADQVFR